MTLLGVPIDSVGEAGGTELGPEVLRGALSGAVPEDAGDTEGRLRSTERDPETGWLAFAEVVEVSREVRGRVAELARSGSVPMVLGGCCTLLPAALAGARDALGSCGLAYLDGHMDLYDGETSPTGEAADMPVATLLGRAPEGLLEALGQTPLADPARIALLGFRDAEEARSLGSPMPAEAGIGIVRDRDSLRGVELERVGAEVEERLAAAGPFWLHLDVDVLDEGAFPATDYLMPDGLSLEELRALILPLARSGALAGLDVTCFNPEKDPEGSCGIALAGLLRSALDLRPG